MKRNVICLGMLIMICFLCAGCGKRHQNVEADSCVYWTVSESKKALMEEQAACWNEQYPDRQIHLEIKVISSDLIDEKLWSALHSGILQLDNGVPDIVDIEYQNMEKYVTPYNCMLYPVNNIVNVYEENYGENKVFDGFTYRDICFGIPEGSGQMVIVYQTDVLEACGIDWENISSMESFEEAGKLYYERSGNYFCSIDMEHYYFFLSLFLQEQTKEEIMKTAYQKTIAKIEELYDKNVICMMEGGRSDSRSFADAFARGKIASVYLPVTAVDDFTEKLDGVSYAVKAIPGGTVSIPEFATAVTIVSEKYSLMQDFLYFARLEGELQADEEFLEDKELQTQNTEEINHYLEVYELELAKKFLKE